MFMPTCVFELYSHSGVSVYILVFLYIHTCVSELYSRCGVSACGLRDCVCGGCVGTAIPGLIVQRYLYPIISQCLCVHVCVCVRVCVRERA